MMLDYQRIEEINKITTDCNKILWDINEKQTIIEKQIMNNESTPELEEINKKYDDLEMAGNKFYRLLSDYYRIISGLEEILKKDK
ncbi:MAG: hypothetical protein IKQ88_05795 [Lachnospiraceae bacterium]|nr:hypothetical protein [Lachnospiraceae bacterium]